MKKLLYLAIPAILAAGCDNKNTTAESTAPSVSPLLVSSGHTPDDKPTISFYFGSTEENFYDVTVNKENIKPGYTVETYKNNNPEVSVNATFDGSNYFLSSKHETNFSFSISETSAQSDSLEVIASGILVNPQTDKTLNLPATKITFPAEMVREGLLEK